MNDFVKYPLRELELESDEGAVSYDLASVVCHHGFADSGHYTCFWQIRVAVVSHERRDRDAGAREGGGERARVSALLPAEGGE